MTVATRSGDTLVAVIRIGHSMQAFGNIATQPERKQSKASGKGYY